MQAFSEAIYVTASWLGAMAAVFGCLALFMKRGRVFSALRKARGDVTINFALALLNGILVIPLMLIPTALIAQVVTAPTVVSDFWIALPLWLTTIVAILIADLGVYWRHRAEHHPLLWRIHATHHSDEHLNWLSVLRKHPLSRILSLCVDYIPLMLLGLPSGAIVLAAFIRGFWGYLIHADVPWTFGLAGRWLMSPAAHRLHHIRDEHLMGANYGNTVTLWDRLFGTYCDPAPHIGCETGIAEGRRSFTGELRRPFEWRYSLVRRRLFHKRAAADVLANPPV